MLENLRSDESLMRLFRILLLVLAAVVLVPLMLSVWISGSANGVIGGLTTDRVWGSLGEVLPLVVGMIAIVIGLQFLLYNFLTRVVKTRLAMPLTLVSPAVVALLIFTVYPFFFNILLSFSDLRIRTFNCYSPAAIGTCQLDHLYGVDYAAKNFRDVFVDVDANGQITGWGRLLRTENSTFPTLFIRTVIWTFLNVVFHFGGGLGLALLLNQKIRFKGLYRSIIVIPWAIPQVIVALSWKGEFHSQFGFINVMLTQLGMAPVSWLDDPTSAFIAVVFINIWLGIPFYMVILLGGLQSLSRDYFEAAEIDGANGWQRFRHITLPLLRPIISPAVTLDVIWTFNLVNIIFLVTGGGPRESTDILVTALYNAAFGPAATQRLGFAAAFSIVLFVILFAFAVIWLRVSGGLKEVYES